MQLIFTARHDQLLLCWFTQRRKEMRKEAKVPAAQSGCFFLAKQQCSNAAKDYVVFFLIVVWPELLIKCNKIYSKT
ncbi:hypothetical protein CLV59_11225 [Chitinophaga dinghuensis]|uniref:Uncharacterized protein n=1 Tax=Chitinophaga dinghuensis TaxID=1539050 RepID=A0A327VIJ0_9BACT|nr:hypothetical protein [Chitinophaga dinghuensis]RAJ73684.1 hypothetical protein CLV59_11225 [Chitinophaga dinghuensis]